MKLKNFFQRIIGIFVVVVLILPIIIVKPIKLSAAGEVKVIAGSNEYGHVTNMVVSVTLVETLPSGGWLDLYFTNMGGVAAFVADDINITKSDGTQLTTSVYATNANAIQFNGLGQDVLAGETIEYHFGLDDDFAAGYVTGNTRFNSAATHLFTNYTSGTDQTISTQSSVAANANLQGTFPLGQAQEMLTMDGYVDPYITMEMLSTSVDLPMSGNEVATDTASIHLASNASSGYIMRYRSTPLAHVNDVNDVFPPATVSSALVAGTEKWGVKMSVVSGGKTSEIISPYDSATQYIIDVSGDLVEVLQVDPNDLGPATSDVTLTVGAASSSTQTAGSYEATMTFNVYATF